MRITPLDVRKQEFRKAMRGLDAEEVYAFLTTVADEYEAVLNDNKALRERLLELDDKVQEYRSMEKTLRDTLLTAERVTVEAKDNARREASLIIKEAQIEAEKALRDIKSEAMRMRQQVQQLRSQRDGYLAKLKVVVESHLDFITTAERDFRHEDKSIDELDVKSPSPASRPADPRPRATSLFESPTRPAPAPSQSPVADGPAPRPVPEAPAAPKDHPRAEAENPAPSNKRSFADLNAILERMAESQRATLQSQPAPPESTNTWQQIAETETKAQTLEHTTTAVEDARGVDPPADVTSKMDLDEIRRRLDESAKTR